MEKMEKEAFDKFKTSISNVAIIKSPNFDYNFILYIFSSDISLVVIPTQKNEEEDECPISSMSTNM